jgi:hypothetical protein
MQQTGENRNAVTSADLDRLHRDVETIGGRAMPDTPDEANDAVERWGRRIGRTLGWLAAAFLFYQLYLTYGA